MLLLALTCLVYFANVGKGLADAVQGPTLFGLARLLKTEIGTISLIYMISRGKPCCRHRFGGQMIAQMNLFRGQMIDHRKRFDGQMIALMTGTFFPLIDHRKQFVGHKSDHLPVKPVCRP